MSFRKVAPSSRKPFQDSSAFQTYFYVSDFSWFQTIFICFCMISYDFQHINFIWSDLLIFYAILFGPISRYQPMVNSEPDSLLRSFLKSFHKKKGSKGSQSWVLGKGWKLFSGWPLGRKWIPTTMYSFISLPVEIASRFTSQVSVRVGASQSSRSASANSITHGGLLWQSWCSLECQMELWWVVSWFWPMDGLMVCL